MGPNGTVLSVSLGSTTSPSESTKAMPNMPAALLPWWRFIFNCFVLVSPGTRELKLTLFRMISFASRIESVERTNKTSTLGAGSVPTFLTLNSPSSKQCKLFGFFPDPWQVWVRFVQDPTRSAPVGVQAVSWHCKEHSFSANSHCSKQGGELKPHSLSHACCSF